MILGMSISTFTLVHVVLSLVGIFAGLIVVFCMFTSNAFHGWTALFLATTVLTSVTGFFFPADCSALKSIQRHSVRLYLDSVRVAGPMASNTLIDLPPEIASRRHQMFPVLTEPEIARISRFGTVQHYPRGTRLFAAGEPGPGMFVVLKGAIAVSQRDGLGHVVPVVRHEPGGFSAEVGQLSGGYSLVDGHAEEDVDALLVPPAQLRALI